MLNPSEKCNYNLNLVQFNKIPKRFLYVGFSINALMKNILWCSYICNDMLVGNWNIFIEIPTKVSLLQTLFQSLLFGLQGCQIFLMLRPFFCARCQTPPDSLSEIHLELIIWNWFHRQAEFYIEIIKFVITLNVINLFWMNLHTLAISWNKCTWCKAAFLP